MKKELSEEEKKRFLGPLYDKFKDKVDWDYYLFKLKIQNQKKQKNS